ncbi:hypothetical protein FOG48_02487 [Hanseniaspora uvarum]|nr:hypothetical protein FOG48_02487 [Hanseniaspora uvarum]
MDSTATTLKDHQIAAIKKMLLFNTAASKTAGDDQEINWKILIMDKTSTGIISSVLRVKDLLKVGVTCHTTLFSPQRQAIPDIPAVYFIEPSRKNLEKIIQDLKNDFYDEYYLNFTSNISRVNLEYLAEEAVKIGKFDRIKQVYDQYLNFVVSDPNVFEIEMEKIWSEFNLNNAITEEEINAKCQEIASRLYNVIITMNSSINSIPILRIQPGGPAEIVGKKLNNLLNEYIINSKQFLEGNTTENSVADLDRPVLVLVDRNVDFTSVLSHSLYYECLVSEVFKLNRNTITLPSGQKIDLDSNDFFWENNNQLPFPEVVENAELELNNYKKETEEITSKTGVNITNLQNLNVGKDGDIQQDTDLIQKAMDKLPELTAKKQFIDNHFKILSELIKELGNLHLDKFYELEQEDIYNIKNRNEFIEILKDPEAGTVSDKIRTYLYIFLKTNMNQLKGNRKQEFENFVEKCDEVFKQLCEKKGGEEEQIDEQSVINSKLLDAIKNIYRYQKMNDMTYYSDDSNLDLKKKNHVSEDTTAKNASYFSSKLYGLANDKLQDSMGSIISRVSNLLTSDNDNLPLTNIVSSIMTSSYADKTEDELNSYEQLVEKYLYLDPTLKKSTLKINKNRKFNKCICFVVGGGSYLEHCNLQRYADKSSDLNPNSGGSENNNFNKMYTDKRIVYGSTTMVSPNEFLKELANL